MLTILTATYNRAELLARLYDSLLMQTDREFEWLIVNDGSNDNTAQTVADWQQQGKINIIYLEQPNLGKCRAVNNGVKRANGDFTAVMDSDDYFLPDAVQRINEAAKGVDDSIGGVFFSQAVIGDNGEIKPNGKFESTLEYVDMYNYQRNNRRFCGDRLEVLRTALMREYPFPEFEGEKFIPESSMFNAISAAGYKFRIYRQTVCIIEYREDGMTRNYEQVRIDSFEGYAYSIKMLHKACPIRKCFWIIRNYARVSEKKGLTIRQAAGKIEVNRLIFLIIRASCFATKKSRN